MANFVTLTCPSCGGQLQITSDIDRFACGHCGTEHLVKRGGGIVSLAPVVEGIKKIQMGVDKTASELAIKRIKSEISDLENQVQEIKDELYSTVSGNSRIKRCDEVLRAYFFDHWDKSNPNRSFFSDVAYGASFEVSIEVKHLTKKDLLNMHEYFSQNPEAIWRSLVVWMYKKPFLHVRKILSPMKRIQHNIQIKQQELERHQKIVDL